MSRTDEHILQDFRGGVQYMLPQNLPLWYTDGVKGTWETADAREALRPSFFFQKAGDKTPMWKVPSLHQEEGRHSYHQTGNLGTRNLCKLVKLNLTFRGTFSPFRTPSPNPSDLPILCKFIVVSLSKRYRSFLLWSYLWVFILLCRLLWKSHQNTEIFYKICMLFSTCLCQFNFQT